MKRFQGDVKILWTYPTPLHSQILRKVVVSSQVANSRLWSAPPWRRCQRSTRVSELPAVERFFSQRAFHSLFHVKFLEFCRCVNCVNPVVNWGNWVETLTVTNLFRIPWTESVFWFSRLPHCWPPWPDMWCSRCPSLDSYTLTTSMAIVELVSGDPTFVHCSGCQGHIISCHVTSYEYFMIQDIQDI